MPASPDRSVATARTYYVGSYGYRYCDPTLSYIALTPDACEAAINAACTFENEESPSNCDHGPNLCTDECATCGEYGKGSDCSLCYPDLVTYGISAATARTIGLTGAQLANARRDLRHGYAVALEAC